MKKPPPSLTILVSCYNEELYIKNVILDLLKEFKDYKYKFEILVIDDSSTDNSVKLLKKLEKKHTNILKIISLNRNIGLGNVYKKGVYSCDTTHLIWQPGDNEISAKSIRLAANEISNYDIVVMYPKNPKIRPIKRQIISYLYVLIINILTFNNLKYYNGSNLHKVSLLKQLKLKTSGFSYQTEILVQLLRKNHSYAQVPYTLNYCSTRNRAVSFKNIFKVVFSLQNIIKYRWL